MVVSTDLEISGEQSGAVCGWKPEKAETSRPGDPKSAGEIEGFAERYRKPYLEALKVPQPNPDSVIERRGVSSVSIQNLHVGGHCAVIGEDRLLSEYSRASVVSIEKSVPEMTAMDDALASVKQAFDSVTPPWKGQCC
ncbi:hypothetical protein [Haloferula sp.]|uniref:hypothetical protein n=1 Tax=Haloferula sp. TaxID=2497595 RepID=UPI00329E28F6